MYAENEPGLSYDQQAYQWAFHASPANMPPAANEPVLLSEAVDELPAITAATDDDVQQHAAELERLRKLVGRWSAFLAVVMLIVIIVGQLALHRTVGPFVAINILLCLVFTFGALLLRAYDRASLLRFLHIYFALNSIVLIASVPVSIYQLTNNPARIDSLCADRGGCTADEQSRFLAYSYVAGALALVVWIFLSTTFLRKQFVLMCALERAHQQPGAGAIHAAVRLVASYLPDWTGWVQSCAGRCCACVAASDENNGSACLRILKVAVIVALACASFFAAPLVWPFVGMYLFRNTPSSSACGDNPKSVGACLGFFIGAGMMLGISWSCDANHISGGAVCTTAKVWSFFVALVR